MRRFYWQLAQPTIIVAITGAKRFTLRFDAPSLNGRFGERCLGGPTLPGGKIIQRKKPKQTATALANQISGVR